MGFVSVGCARGAVRLTAKRQAVCWIGISLHRIDWVKEDSNSLGRTESIA